MQFPSVRWRYALAGMLLATCFTAQAASNGPGVVVTDIPITHSLVSMVMGDLGNPELLMKDSASPHDYALRPSEAKNLQSADVLFWVSRDLTPWLSRTLQNGRRQITHVELMNAPETLKLSFRDDAVFSDGHDHDHGHTTEHDSEHGHDEHNNSNHDSTSSPTDPHGWLDPVNGIYWLQLIASRLSTLDPDNATRYRDNAAAAQANLKSVQQDIQKQLGSVSGSPFIVFHDSYHYFENRFNIHAQAAIALGDAQMPGIQRMNKLRDKLREFEGACVFTEPQFNDRLVNSLTRGMQLSTGSLDPLGTSLQQGPKLYVSTLRQIADQLYHCLTKQKQ